MIPPPSAYRADALPKMSYPSESLPRLPRGFLWRGLLLSVALLEQLERIERSFSAYQAESLPLTYSCVILQLSISCLLRCQNKDIFSTQGNLRQGI